MGSFIESLIKAIHQRGFQQPNDRCLSVA